MKKAMILMLVTLAVLISSCGKKDQTNTATTAATTSLPTKASNYVATNYPDATIDYILVLTNSSAKYIVSLNTTEELAFNGDGDYLGNGCPFLQGHHPGDTIFCDSNGGDGHHGHDEHDQARDEFAKRAGKVQARTLSRLGYHLSCELADRAAKDQE